MSKDLRLDIAIRLRRIRSQFIDRGYPYLLDGLCECGDYLSCHTDLLDLGHGSCLLCECKRFTWVGFIVKQGVTNPDPPKPPVPQICPLHFISNCLSPDIDREYAACIKGDCAWWTHDNCAMVDLSAGIDAVASKFDAIERHLYLIANHTGDR